jgi:hypothetical protein
MKDVGCLQNKKNLGGIKWQIKGEVSQVGFSGCFLFH